MAALLAPGVSLIGFNGMVFISLGNLSAAIYLIITDIYYIIHLLRFLIFSSSFFFQGQTFKWVLENDMGWSVSQYRDYKREQQSDNYRRLDMQRQPPAQKNLRRNKELFC